MAQISGKGSKGHHTFRLNLTETGTSIANNTSTLDASFTLDATSWYWEGWGSNITYTITINGTNYTGSIPSIPNNKAYTIRTITGISVEHKDDGTKTVSYSFSVSDKANQDYTCGSASASGTMALTNIPRASTISSITSSVNIGSTCNIGISKKLGTYTSTLDYQISGSSTWTSIASKWNPNSNLEQTYPWTVPTSVYNSMTSTDTQKTITVRLTTYNGDSTIGSVSTSSFTAKATGTPSIASTSVVDTNSTTTTLTSDNSKMVNGVSNMKVTVNAAGVNGTTITKITCNGTTMSLSSGVGTITYNACTTTSFAIVVTDSRGATKSSTIDISSKKINYVMLSATMTAEKDQPTSSSAILSAKGNYSSVSFASGVSNTLTTSYKYRLSGSTGSYTSGNFSVSTSGTTYTATKTISGLDYTKDYEVVMTIADKLTTLTQTLILKKGIPVFYWDKNAVYLKSGNPILDYTKVSHVDETTLNVVEMRNASGSVVHVNPFPVGAVYISTVNKSPARIYGGTWTQITGRFLYCTTTSKTTGGASSVSYTPAGTNTGHAITAGQMPSHSHCQRSRTGDGNWNTEVSATGGSSGGAWPAQAGWTNYGNGWNTGTTTATGSGETHTHTFTGTAATINTMPPWFSVYAWHRTA